MHTLHDIKHRSSRRFLCWNKASRHSVACKWAHDTKGAATKAIKDAAGRRCEWFRPPESFLLPRAQMLTHDAHWSMHVAKEEPCVINVCFSNVLGGRTSNFEDLGRRTRYQTNRAFEGVGIRTLLHLREGIHETPKIWKSHGYSSHFPSLFFLLHANKTSEVNSSGQGFL